MFSTTATTDISLPCALLPCQGHRGGLETSRGEFQWWNKEKRRARKGQVITAKLELKPPPYPLNALEPHKPISLPNHVLSRRCRYRGGGRGIAVKTWAMGGEDLLGDFGARDPFPAEIESGFADKVLGNTNTEHKILIPNVSAFSLAQQDCNPAVSPFQQPMSEQDAQKLLRKIIGWRLLDEGGGQRLQCMWKLKDFKSGVELINRIYKVVEAAGHFPNLHLEQPNQVRAELWTASIGGLSMNDFIVAAKIDEIKMSDLVPRKRIWA